jgi:DNA (cytosine-5)-methyltransferase 1
MLKFIDTFAGIGGFHLAMQEVNPKAKCVLSMEIDKSACETYVRNFGIDPFCDVTEKEAHTYPDHDILFGGFPCQPFSRNGKFYNKNDKRLGDDDRKNLVVFLMEVLRVKKPSFFVFENVKEILTILNEDGSSFFNALMENLDDCGYDVACEVIDTKNFGIPQQRRRAYFVGARKDLGVRYVFPNGKKPSRCVQDIMEDVVDEKYLLENLWANRKYGAQDGRPVGWIIKAMRA